jgi:MFS family permease
VSVAAVTEGWSRSAVIGAAAVFGLAYGLTAPLIAQALHARGLGETLIGLNAAMYALGVLAVAEWLPRLAQRFGLRAVMAAALAAVALLLPAFHAAPWIALWFPLRFLLGAASEGVFVMSETWVNGLTAEASRAATIAFYTAALSLGFALGPVILAATGASGALPYAVGSACALAALLAIAWPSIRTPPLERNAPHARVSEIARLAPLALAATALNSALETAGLTFMPIYAMRLGWDPASANLLVATIMLGAIVLQLPIGWLGDRSDRRALVLALAAVATAGAAAWPFVLHDRWLAHALAFVWGGAFVGIYTLMVTAVGSRFSGSALLAVYAVMSAAWAAGAIAGPAITGAAMELSRHGLPLFAAAACAAFGLLAWHRPALA